MTTHNRRLKAALDAFHRGWYVFPQHTINDKGYCTCRFGPTCEHPGKHPDTRHGLKDATRDEAQIRRWWRRKPQANIGIATGKKSGLVVLDVDVRSGGFKALADLEQELGPLPATPMVCTGSGGWHLYFAHPGGHVKSLSAALRPGLDIKGDGGSVVAPPSRHVSGKEYVWREDYGPDNFPLAELPARWLEKLRPPEKPKKAPTAAGDGDKVTAGGRNVYLTSLAGTMKAKGSADGTIESALLAENEAHCDPPLDDDEVRGIARSVGKYPAGEAGADEVDRLAGLPVLEYERMREKAAKALGARVGVLDGLVADRRRELQAKANGNGLDGNPEPWPEPVDGATLLEELRETAKAYVVLPEHGAEATALWALFSHAHDHFDVSPIAAFESPQKRCGKTTLQAVLGGLCPRPLTAANVTPALVFRVIEAAKPTLLIDEADTFLKDNEELKGVLNSEAEPRKSGTWCPKSIALIGELPDTLQDRSIVLRLRRKLRSEQVARWRADKVGDFEGLKRRAARWAEDNLEALRLADPELPEALNDRQADNWRPLVAIADRAGGEWPRLARKAALALSGQADAEDEQGAGVRLLADCKEVFEQAVADALPPTELTKRLCELPEASWAAWGKYDKPITAAGVALLLKPFGIKSAGMTRKYGPLGRYYVKNAFEDAWARYIPENGHVSNVSDETPPPGGIHMKGDGLTAPSDPAQPIPLFADIAGVALKVYGEEAIKAAYRANPLKLWTLETDKEWWDSLRPRPSGGGPQAAAGDPEEDAHLGEERAAIKGEGEPKPWETEF